MKEAFFDVLAVGGGPAGLALALTLRRHSSLSVAVVERTAYEAPRLGETLSPGVRGLLDYLGIWEGFEADGHLPAFGTSAAWGGPQLATRDFLMTPFGSGWHLDRRRFDARLAATAEAAGAAVWLRSRMLRVDSGAEAGWTVVIERAGQCATVRARFLVDATGKTGALARRLGADRRTLDQQVAVLATVFRDMETPVENLTVVEACEIGWWYSVKLPAHTLLVALITDADLARAWGLARAAVWWRAAAAMPHTAPRLQGARLTAPPRIVAAHSACLMRVTGQGWLAAGDAAACHDPLSSSGIARALDSGIRAARAIHGVLVQGQPEDALAEYESYMGLGYDQYCATRASYYQIETRWPEATYWRRRQPRVTLDPHGWLERTVPAPSQAPAPRLPADLRHVDASLLLGLAQRPRPAHELVAEHRLRAPSPVGDLQVILALQWLLATGALRPVPAALVRGSHWLTCP